MTACTPRRAAYTRRFSLFETERQSAINSQHSRVWMKILYVITRGDDLGGAQTHVLDMAESMERKGHDTKVIVGSSGSFTDQLDHRGVRWELCRGLHREIRLGHDFSGLAELRAMLLKEAPDLVSLHSSKAGFLGRLACRSASVPCVFTAHGWAFSEGVPKLRRSIFQRLERSIEGLAKRVICVSDYDRGLGIAAGMSHSRLVRVHNGVAEHPTPRAAAGPAEGCRVVMVARFGFPKDQLMLLRVAARVPGVSIVFVGDGPLLTEAKREVQRLGFVARVDFRGRSTDVATTLSQSDVFCLLSRHEGFPYTTLEAMRAGLPTVVSDVGGAGEAVRDGETGFLIPRGDEDRLYACLSLLANQPWLRLSMGAAARRHFLQSFTFDRMFDRTLAVYEEVLSGHN